MNRPRSKNAPQKARLTKVEDTSLRRIGLVAAFGFVVGVAWPQVAGVKLIPEAPVDELKAIAAPQPEPVIEVTKPEAAPKAAEVPAAPPTETLTISEVEIVSCRGADAKERKSCGELDVDAQVQAKLASLSSCPARAGISGLLSLGFELDYASRTVEKVRSGKSTDLPDSVRDELLGCAKKSLSAVKLPAKKPEFVHYTVFFKLNFGLAEAKGAAAVDVVGASGEALVRWPTALIRSQPERNAEVRARVLEGAKLTVTGRKSEWYRVKYDAKGREGWVHGAALGLKNEPVLEP